MAFIRGSEPQVSVLIGCSKSVIILIIDETVTHHNDSPTEPSPTTHDDSNNSIPEPAETESDDTACQVESTATVTASHEELTSIILYNLFKLCHALGRSVLRRV